MQHIGQYIGLFSHFLTNVFFTNLCQLIGASQLSQNVIEHCTIFIGRNVVTVYGDWHSKMCIYSLDLLGGFRTILKENDHSM